MLAIEGKDEIDTCRDDERRRGTSFTHVRSRQRTVNGRDRPTKDAFFTSHEARGGKANQETHPWNLGSVSVSRLGYNAVCWTMLDVSTQTFQSPPGGWNERRTIVTHVLRRKPRSMHPRSLISCLDSSCYRNDRWECVWSETIVGAKTALEPDGNGDVSSIRVPISSRLPLSIAS